LLIKKIKNKQKISFSDNVHAVVCCRCNPLSTALSHARKRLPNFTPANQNVKNYSPTTEGDGKTRQS